MVVSYPVLCEIQNNPLSYINEIDALLDVYQRLYSKKTLRSEDLLELLVFYKIITKIDNKHLLLKIEQIIEYLSDALLQGTMRDVRNYDLNDFLSPTAKGVFVD